jgi:hypothetical protein
MVRDLGDALRTAEHRLGFADAREFAGVCWWLVPADTAAVAVSEARRLSQRRHARQVDFDVIHHAIRSGLDPDLSPLFALGGADHRRRDHPLIVVPI